MNEREFNEFQNKMADFRNKYEETRLLFMEALRCDLGIPKDRVDKNLVPNEGGINV